MADRETRKKMTVTKFVDKKRKGEKIAVLTAYLALLDRFWGFVTNLIYSSGV